MLQESYPGLHYLRMIASALAFCVGTCLFTTLLAPYAVAADTVGDFSLSSYLLEPYSSFAERRNGAFHAGNSYVELSWKQDQGLLSAVFKAGSTSLTGIPARYGIDNALFSDEKIGFVEAYGQAASGYGRIRIGIVPIVYGLEGGDSEMSLRFPRSLIFSRGFINIRDQGITYRISNGGFFSDWAVHNGEGGTDLDNQLWFTARAGWQSGQTIKLGVSATTGRTTPKSTDPLGTGGTPATDAAAGMDIARNAKIRIGNVFARIGDRKLGFEIEGNIGDTNQDGLITKLAAARADVDWQFWGELAALARYDVLSQSGAYPGDSVTAVSAGFAWRNPYETSVVTLLATRQNETGLPETSSVLISWRLTPVAMGRLGTL